MNVYITKNIEEITRTLTQFGETYKEALGYEVGYLNAHLKMDQLGLPLTDAFFEQIYEAAGLIRPSCSVYKNMYDLIRREFNLKRDVVEIGSGIFPLLGHSLREYQLKIGGGTVTVYDSRVWKGYPTKAKLVNRYFNDKIKLEKSSLLVGLFPCEATEMIIKRALKENLDFCIALCGCNHSNDPSLTTREYHGILIEQLMEQVPPEKFLKVKYFPKACFGNQHNGYPILLVKDKPKVKIFALPSKTR